MKAKLYKYISLIGVLSLLSTIALSTSVIYAKADTKKQAYSNAIVTHKEKAPYEKKVKMPSNEDFKLLSYSSSYYKGDKKDALFSQLKIDDKNNIICDTKDFIKDDDTVITIDSKLKSGLRVNAEGTVKEYGTMLKTMLLLSGIDKMDISIKSTKPVNISKLFVKLYDACIVSIGGNTSEKTLKFQQSLLPLYEKLYNADKNMQSYLSDDFYKDLITVISLRQKVGAKDIGKAIDKLPLGSNLSQNNLKLVKSFIIKFAKEVPTYKVDNVFEKTDNLLLISYALANN